MIEKLGSFHSYVFTIMKQTNPMYAMKGDYCGVEKNGSLTNG